jgi:hypothetical protein
MNYLCNAASSLSSIPNTEHFSRKFKFSFLTWLKFPLLPLSLQNMEILHDTIPSYQCFGSGHRKSKISQSLQGKLENSIFLGTSPKNSVFWL